MSNTSGTLYVFLYEDFHMELIGLIALIAKHVELSVQKWSDEQISTR